MAVFRLQEHSPDVYPRKSRDYQLFSVIFDCMNGGVKYDIDSIRDVIDTNQCNERLIPYLQTKLGFFTKLHIPTDKLRTILKAFPEIVRHKGSLYGIQQAVEVFIKVEKLDVEIEVTIDNSRRSVIISTNKKINDYSILKEILRYVLPAGYMLEFMYKVPDGMFNVIKYADTIRLVSADETLTGGVRLDFEDEEGHTEVQNMPEVISGIGTSIIVKKNKKTKYLNGYYKQDEATGENVFNNDSLKGEYKKYGRADLWEYPKQEE